MPSEYIEHIKSELEKRPIVFVDRLLELSRRIPKANGLQANLEALQSLCEGILLSLNAAADLKTQNPLHAIFEKHLRIQDQKFIVSCLLRLLAYNENFFHDSQFRIKAFTLFDNILSDDVYPLIKIKDKSQTFEKEKALKEMVINTENELLQLLNTLNSLQALQSFRNQFNRQINSIFSKAVVLPFLPRELLRLRLNDIFAVTEECVRERGYEVINSYHRATSGLKLYFEDALQFGTRYSREILGELSKRLQHFLEVNLSTTQISQPAQILLKNSEKKYPLHMSDIPFNLTFLLENVGPGHAFDVQLKIEATDAEIGQTEFPLGHFNPGTRIVDVPVRVFRPIGSILVEAKLEWINFDRSMGHAASYLEFIGQRSDVDWVTLSVEELYSLEPVEKEDELVGRKEVIESLLAQSKATSIGSCYIFGQKRVGKTSVVKTLRNVIEENFEKNYLVLYLERGDYICPQPSETLRSLGQRICHEVMISNNVYKTVRIPLFSEALSPLTEFLDTVIQINPRCRILFILDEFDELPMELYKRGSLGDAFFGTLRSISGKPPFGIILVGGENMEYVMNFQGYALNKFKSVRLDYFDKEEHWTDFQELVRRPVERWLEVSEDALMALYDQTAGNPFFTKLICGRLIRMMVDRKDCHVTRAEVDEAVRLALQRDMASNTVQHFWTDGIFETGMRQEEIILRRKKLLLCLAEIFRKTPIADKKCILRYAEDSYGLPTHLTESLLREFQRRRIIYEKNGELDFLVPFFKAWLTEKGFREIMVTVSDEEEFQRYKKLEEDIRIGSTEIEGLMTKWGLFKGERIEEKKIRQWLNQFGDNANQRLMFQLLQDVRFYKHEDIQKKMREGFLSSVQITWKIEEKKRKRSDVLVTYLENEEKIGNYYARVFASENDIYIENIVEVNKIRNTIGEKKEVQALVVVDDFIGTGDTAVAFFGNMIEGVGQILKENNIGLYYIVISGFSRGKLKLEEFLRRYRLGVKIHICDLLDESNRIFEQDSKVFSTTEERLKAKTLCEQHGSTIERRFPLGYGDLQGLVVFENRCPKGDLPILWGESKEWVPLFRHEPSLIRMNRRESKMGDTSGKIKYNWLKAIAEGFAHAAGPLGAPLKTLISLQQDEKVWEMNGKIDRALENGESLAEEIVKEFRDMNLQSKMVNETIMEIVQRCINVLENIPVKDAEVIFRYTEEWRFLSATDIMEVEVKDELVNLYGDDIDLLLNDLRSVSFPVVRVRKTGTTETDIGNIVSSMRGKTIGQVHNVLKTLTQKNPGSEILIRAKQQLEKILSLEKTQ